MLKRSFEEEISEDKKILEIINAAAENIQQRCDLKKAVYNCGYLVIATIETLSALLEDKAPPQTEISLDSTIDMDLASIRYQTIEIKTEQTMEILDPHMETDIHEYGIVTKDKIVPVTPWPFHFQAIRGGSALHARLPQQQFSQFDIENQTESKTNKDLNPGHVTLKNLDIDNAETILKKEAADLGGITVGHIALIFRKNKKAFHLAAFCATRNKVYYIDGQDYNPKVGIIFYDLKKDYKAFRHAFYLIHKIYPSIAESPAKKHKEEVSNQTFGKNK